MKGRGLLGRAFNAARRKTVDYVKKNPKTVATGTAITAGVGATGLAAVNRAKKSRQESEQRIMREYLGAPGAKYSSCELLNTFVDRKMELATKVAFTDTPPSFDRSMETGAGSAVGGGVIREGIAAIRRLLGMSSQAIADRVVAEPKRKKIMNEDQINLILARF